MTSSQRFLPVEEIKDNLIFLKDGSVSLVLSTSAVNFGLLFETEQASIIEAFAGLLNSLSFPLQIVILSKRLDVSSYLNTLDKALALQSNPLLKNITLRYRQFIESTIKENNVLDKEFYVCLTVTAFELGILPKQIADRSQTASTILNPRRDHLIKQLNSLGLKVKQLTSVELIKLFYDVYNPAGQNEIKKPGPMVSQSPEVSSPPKIPPLQPPSVPPTQLSSVNYPLRREASQPRTINPLIPPFVVEELNDDF